MGAVRITACAALALLVALAGCGASNPTEGLISNVDKANSARTLTSLQQALITVNIVQADAAASGPSALAAALQQRDPSNRYTTVPPTDAGIVQVIGGGGVPVMLVGINSPPSSGRTPYYLAVWSSGGSTLFYLGQPPPQYSAQQPSGPGWSSSPQV
jgi:ABC-type Fe3+-hydroxamate transport system substrate-binding protein